VDKIGKKETKLVVIDESWQGQKDEEAEFYIQEIKDHPKI
jgi:hypothetical protein